MKWWNLGGRHDLDNEGDGLIHDYEMPDNSDVSMEFCLSIREW